MARLFLRLTGPAFETDDGLDAPCQWLLLRETGEGVAEGSGSLVDLGQARPWGDDAPEVIALAPVERVLCLSRTVPGRSVSQIARALPFAVEEFVTQDIETMHLAHGPITRGQPVACVLVDRQLLADWLGAIGSTGLAPTFMTPDAGLLPEGCEVAVLFEGDDALLRTPGHLTRIDHRALPQALAAVVPDAGEDAQRLEVIGGTLGQTDALHGVFPGEVEARPLGGTVLRCLASHFATARHVNMLQGAFAPPRRRGGERNAGASWLRWRRCGSSCSRACASARACGPITAPTPCRPMPPRSSARSTPKPRPPRNAYTEMRRRVGQPDRPSAADFEMLLGALALAIDSALEGVELQSLSYSASRGELTTELSLREYADLDRLRLQLEGQGVVVHIGSAEEQDGIVRAPTARGDGMMLADRLRASALARRYGELSAREKRLVNLGGAVVAAAVVYLGVVDPVQAFHDDAMARYRQQQAQFEWMLRHQAEAARQESSAGPPARNQSLLTLIDQTARGFDLRLASYRSESGGGVSVVVQEQPFNDIPAMDPDAGLRARYSRDPGVHRRPGRGGWSTRGS